jgi:hypothetical protein
VRRFLINTAGQAVALETTLNWAGDIIAESHAGFVKEDTTVQPEVHVAIQDSRAAFDTSGWAPLARGAWVNGGSIVVRDICTSGFDMHACITPDGPEFTFRWRPPTRTRALAYALRSRWHLLVRSALLQYPALWWAGVNGGVLMHAAVCTTGPETPLMAGAAGVGKTTALVEELQRGERAVSDNICVLNGDTAWGLVEPIRIEGGEGRKMPHGRREVPLENRAASLTPTCVVILKRASGRSAARPCSPDTAARNLVAGTYMAGELRRYWNYSATLALGTGVGPTHPPIAALAASLTTRLPCYEVSLARADKTSLGELIEHAAAKSGTHPSFRHLSVTSHREDSR